MLKEIRIENLALIDYLHLSLEQGLTVFTGETGAGKSIVLQAIALLTGGRAAASWVRTGAQQAMVEALFDRPDHPGLQAELEAMGFGSDDDILIKRLLSADGKSRFYLNGGLATARQVQTVGEHLLSVASQHEHQQLLTPRYHLDFIDLVGDLWPQREQVASLFEQWAAARKELDSLRLKEQDKEQRRDFLSYQYREIAAAAIEVGEDQRLQLERQRLKGSTDLNRLGQKCRERLNAAAEALGLARKEIEAMAVIDPQIAELATQISEQSFLIEDQAGQLRDYLNHLPDDESQLEEIAARLTLLQQLKRKYGEELADILAYGERAREELAALDSLDETIARLAKRSAGMEAELVAAADQLSADRQRVAEDLGRAIQRELQALSFAQAEFQAVFKDCEREGLSGMSRSGWDRCEFMFSANPGEPVRPLIKIASGGELSRVMLAMRCLLARKDSVATVIFDEIDSGIGGKAAEAVARKIRELARHHQVICITHLPQIAASGTAHLLVEKRLSEGRTVTAITPLNDQARLAEIARMLDGDSVSAQSMAFAAELIERHRQLPGASA